MWELNGEEGWALTNWCFWSVVLEKTLESPLDCKEIQPVHSEGDQPWDFFGRNDAKAEAPVFWPPHAKRWLIGKDSDAGRDWGQEEKGTTEDEMAWWHHWLDGRESEWTPGVVDGQGGLAYYASWGRKELDTTERLICSDLNDFLNFYPEEYLYPKKWEHYILTEPNLDLLSCSHWSQSTDTRLWWRKGKYLLQAWSKESRLLRPKIVEIPNIFEGKVFKNRVSESNQLMDILLICWWWGNLMWRTDSFEKTLMLGKIEGRRRRGWQRMRWLDGITDSMDMSLSNYGSLCLTGSSVMLQSTGSQRVRHDWATELR